MAEKNSLWKNIRNKAAQNKRTGATPKKPTTEMLRQERKIRAQKADGGPVNTLEGDLISKVIMNRNRDKDFVKRAYAVGEYPESNMFVQPDANEFGEKNSHLMSWGEDESGQAYMYPAVMNPSNEAIKVPNQYADYISSTGYKKVTGIPHAQGGYYPTQGPGKALFKGYAEGGEDDKNKTKSDYSEPRYVTERSTTSTKATPAMSTKKENSNITRGEDTLQAIKLALDFGQFTPLAPVAYAASLPFTTADVVKNIYNSNYKQAAAEALGYIPMLKGFKAAGRANAFITTGDIINDARINEKSNGGYNINNNNKSMKNNTQSWKEYLKYAQGGHTNPYNQYQDDQYLQYEVGGKVWKNIAAGLYGAGEGILDTVTMGATDDLTDKGFEALSKAGTKNIDLNNPDDVKFLKTQQKVKGYSNAAGAIGTAAVTGNVQGAIKQGTKGLNTAFQATDGMSDDFKKWSQGVTGVAGVASGFAGGLNSSSFNAAQEAGTGVAGFGQKVGKYSPLINQASGMMGGNEQPLWQQGDAQQKLANSPDKIASDRERNESYANQGLMYSQGGNMSNNSLNLRNTMGNNRFAQGGAFEQYGINMIPDSAGLHHQSAYGGVPIGPNALAEGGEIKMDNGDGSQYIVSDQVDGAETQKDFTFSKGGKYKELNRTLADGMKQDLNKYTYGSLATSDRIKSDLRRPNDSYGQSTVDQIKERWQQKTEYARQRSQQDQVIAQAEEQKKMAEEQYVAAYGGRINPKKYPGLNMTKKAKGGYVHNQMTQPMYAKGGPTDPPLTPEELKWLAVSLRGTESANYLSGSYGDNSMPGGNPDRVKQLNSAQKEQLNNYMLNTGFGTDFIEAITPNIEFFNPKPAKSKLAQGGPLYGDPASPYTYAMGGENRPWNAPIPIGNMQPQQPSPAGYSSWEDMKTKMNAARAAMPAKPVLTLEQQRAQDSQTMGKIGEIFSSHNQGPNRINPSFPRPTANVVNPAFQNQLQNTNALTRARGGQIDYTNDMYSMYAGGGPMPSDLPQAFDGPSAQNSNGMYAYPDGGKLNSKEAAKLAKTLSMSPDDYYMSQYNKLSNIEKAGVKAAYKSYTGTDFDDLSFKNQFSEPYENAKDSASYLRGYNTGYKTGEDFPKYSESTLKQGMTNDPLYRGNSDGYFNNPKVKKADGGPGVIPTGTPIYTPDSGIEQFAADPSWYDGGNQVAAPGNVVSWPSYPETYGDMEDPEGVPLNMPTNDPRERNRRSNDFDLRDLGRMWKHRGNGRSSGRPMSTRPGATICTVHPDGGSIYYDLGGILPPTGVQPGVPPNGTLPPIIDPNFDKNPKFATDTTVQKPLGPLDRPSNYKPSRVFEIGSKGSPGRWHDLDSPDPAVRKRAFEVNRENQMRQMNIMPFMPTAKAEGGMMPPEQQMQQDPQQQQMQEQQGGGQEQQMMQMVQQVEQMLQQGAEPQQVMQQLVQSGVPQEQAQQVVQIAMQELQGQMQQQEQGQQPMQGQEQQMPPQQGMARGGYYNGKRQYYTGGTEDENLLVRKNLSPTVYAEPLVSNDEYNNLNTQRSYDVSNAFFDNTTADKNYNVNANAPVIVSALPKTNSRTGEFEDYLYNSATTQTGSTSALAGNQSNTQKEQAPMSLEPLLNVVNDQNNREQLLSVLPAKKLVEDKLKEDKLKEDKKNENKKDNKTNTTTTQTKTPKGSKMSATDLAFMAAQLAGPAHQFFQKKPKPFQYQKAQAKTLDPSTAIMLAEQASREAEAGSGYAIRQAAPTAGSYLANIRANALNSAKQRGQSVAGIRGQYDLQNAGILNQFEQYNTELANKATDAMQQDQANYQEQRTNALYNAGANLPGMRKDYNAGEIDQLIANNIGTSNYKYDQAKQTITYKKPDGKEVTVPVSTVLGSNTTT